MSTRQILLMRHAKSDWGDRSLSDHERPLNLRGLHDAPRMAHWLATNDLIPDLILCSTAVRARETVDLMMKCWSGSTKLVHLSDLYLAVPETIIEIIAQNGDGACRVMVMAHNPGISAAVGAMTQHFHQMPTAAVAVIDVQCEAWRDLKADGKSVLMLEMRPKALPADDDESR
ncbi:histidine phosphatase family protein [Rubripirellula amarantea]|uniref:Phosphohistidine phosphatase n=1 Tax=Rubripirellula amarantea TaxID=2527999 RepID=A0A5C5WW76_9BACT|nr:histidine phosphatase family protein [Rubripirellula amarantea]MDA8744676.1 histidine phosphatase family protein [Rubripirellula amarantea]TWT54401.1 phosphohistidine phosphatase [Rubripirellula amarantea]